MELKSEKFCQTSEAVKIPPALVHPKFYAAARKAYGRNCKKGCYDRNTEIYAVDMQRLLIIQY